MEAILEPRLVMQGEPGVPYIEGEFFVASYQRGYRWGRHEVRQLLDDIRSNARAAEANRTTAPDYFLQPIVVLARDDGSWELVDGQQRLTTLFLIAKYVGTKLQDDRLGYALTYETRPGSRDYLQTLDPARRDENIDFFHMAGAYEVIEEWFNEADHGNPITMAIDFYKALSTWVKVIWYEAPKGTNPNALFTRLNRDRIPLTDSELIKALVLSKSAATAGTPGRQEEVAAQWDSFERDLRGEQFWTFLTGSTEARPTHIDFMFESMTPAPPGKVRPRFWTFERVRDDVADRGAAAFWRDVVARHGLLIGWFQDRELYHRVGYLVATGDSIPALVEASRLQAHTAFRAGLRQRTRERLALTTENLALLRYGNRQDAKCSDVLLLMNVETVLASSDLTNRFAFHAYAGGGWSLEHIHAQNAEGLTTENQRRDWLKAHQKKIETTTWPPEQRTVTDLVLSQIEAHLSMPLGKTDDVAFQDILNKVFGLFGAPTGDGAQDDMHGLGNLALLQREINSKLNNAVFALKRERIVELDQDGAYILPCTRNVFLKYYTAAEDQQLSLWGPQDQEAYFAALIEKVGPFLLDSSDLEDAMLEETTL